MRPTGNKAFFSNANAISLTWKAGRPDFPTFKYSRSGQFHQRNVETIPTNHILFMNFYARHVEYIVAFVWAFLFCSLDLSYNDTIIIIFLIKQKV